MIRTLRFEDNKLILLNQTKLPLVEEYKTCTNTIDVWNAIKNLEVRGAPAIGVAAAYGIVLSCLEKSELYYIQSSIHYLRSCRPTAVNLSYALNRMAVVANKSNNLYEDLLGEARKIQEEDEISCRKIGENGASLIKDGMNIITHCNAGALATAGIGTALSVFYVAKEQGKHFHVYVDETRPLLQGARLTAWELTRANIPCTLICDNMAAWVMKNKNIDMALVGADRIACNGDVANKIGTYGLAILSHYHNVDFYVAAPLSTFDWAAVGGEQIVIEERLPEEVKSIRNIDIAEKDMPVFNPAFDITPKKLIKGYITEKGINNAFYS